MQLLSRALSMYSTWTHLKLVSLIIPFEPPMHFKASESF